MRLTIVRLFLAVVLCLVLLPGGSAFAAGGVSGKVVDDGGAGIANIPILIWQGTAPSGRPYEWPPTTKSGTDGSYSYADLPAGQYTLVANAGPAANAIYTSSDPVTVTVGEGQTVTQNLTISFVNVKGRILKPDGTAAGQGEAGALVYTADRAVNKFGICDANGVFKVGGLSPNIYYVQLQSVDLTNVVAPDPTIFRLTSATEVIDLGDLKFDASIKHLDVTVRRSDNTPPGGAVMVNAHKHGAATNINAFTDAQGQARLELRPGDWEVMVLRDMRPGAAEPDWAYGKPPVVIYFADNQIEETKSISFTVTAAPHTVTGAVKNPDGTTPADNTVFVVIHNQEGLGNNGPVQGGRFSIRVPGGSYLLGIHTGSATVGAPRLNPFIVPDTVGTTD
ncbi:MAG: carboxypeptidase-like regulatory domain-containing protein, partial [Chloroflexi bacterium]|nr:carboxypeptidase-like regulatory domain-containing protein [Chloroflexota bacterium]